ncbi:MAG: hypothetical protein A2Y33_05300 [Spirochaetes bacterium GWF1_51_8]|nr:MAG: hypothetical protein A2Y33_05300 [Spirochaetes bacterium GWF1_51_8]
MKRRSFANGGVLVFAAAVFMFSTIFLSCGSGDKKAPGAEPASQRTSNENTLSSGGAEGTGDFVRLLAAKDDTLHAVYLDSGHIVHAVKKPGQAWWDKYIVNPGVSNHIASGYIAASFDKNETIHLIYTSPSSEWVYGYLPYGSREWKLTNIEFAEKPAVIYHTIDMTVDEWAGVHVVAGGVLRGEYVPIYLYKPEDGEWAIDKVNTQMADLPQRGNDPSIHVIASNIYVSYGGNSDIHYAYKTIGVTGWINEPVFRDDFKLMNREKNFTSIVVSPEKTIWIVYADNSDKKLKMAFKQNEGTWKSGEIKGVAGEALFPSFTADSTSGMHLVYHSYKDKAFYYAYKLAGGLTWKTIKLGDSKKEGYTALAVDSKNTAHVCYVVTENKQSTLKYKKIEMAP